MSAVSRFGAARRGIIRRQKKAGIAKGIFDTAATVATFVGGQAKKGQTAWEDYEAGYKELGGEGFERPKFGQKGFFKGPEGEVRIGNTMYDRGKIQKAGAFLGSDAASMLSDEQRSKYLGRTAPGTALPDRSFAIGGAGGVKLGQTGGGGVAGWSLTGGGTGGRFSPVTPKTVSTSEGIGVGTGFGGGTGSNVQHELTGGDFQPFVSGGERGRGAAETVGIQARQQEQLNLMSQGRAPGVFRQTREGGAPVQQDNSLDAELQRQSASGTAADRMGIAIPSKKTYSEPIQESEYGGVDPNPRGRFGIPYYDANTGKWEKRYAQGGDFITNGPQKILVGDNPGGRERVTITPLDSDDIKGYYGEKRNWLEALYENNRSRKR